MKTFDDFVATIPSTWREPAAAAGCVEAGFGAGPGCMAGKVEHFEARAEAPRPGLVVRTRGESSDDGAGTR